MKSDEKHGHNSNAELLKTLASGNLPLPDGYELPEHHGPHDTFKTIREATYRDKAIRVETTYKITIDEKPVTAHTVVLDDGSVHCHSLPNYSFTSAMDLARRIVDAPATESVENELVKQDSHHNGGHA